MLFFGLPVKEPNSINITLMVWETIVVFDFCDGRIGAFLWEWLAMGVRAQSGCQGNSL